MQPQRGVREGWLIPGEVVPGQLRSGVGGAPLDHPLLQPRQERRAGEPRVEEPGAQLGEPQRLPADVVGLGRRRRGEPGQFLVRGQVPVPDQRGRGHLQVHGAEQLPVQPGLLGGHHVRRGGGQPDDPGVGQFAHDRQQQPSPDLQQVMALIKDQRGGAGRLEGGEQALPVRVQGGEQLPVGEPADAWDEAVASEAVLVSALPPLSAPAGSKDATAWYVKTVSGVGRSRLAVARASCGGSNRARHCPIHCA